MDGSSGLQSVGFLWSSLKIPQTKVKSEKEMVLIESFKLSYKIAGKGKSALLDIRRQFSMVSYVSAQVVTRTLHTFVPDCLFGDAIQQRALGSSLCLPAGQWRVVYCPVK